MNVETKMRMSFGSHENWPFILFTMKLNSSFFWIFVWLFGWRFWLYKSKICHIQCCKYFYIIKCIWLKDTHTYFNFGYRFFNLHLTIVKIQFWSGYNFILILLTRLNFNMSIFIWTFFNSLRTLTSKLYVCLKI